jgi:hypothetical protein
MTRDCVSVCRSACWYIRHICCLIIIKLLEKESTSGGGVCHTVLLKIFVNLSAGLLCDPDFMLSFPKIMPTASL